MGIPKKSGTPQNLPNHFSLRAIQAILVRMQGKPRKIQANALKNWSSHQYRTAIDV